MFIAAEWYEGEGGTSAPSQHLAKIAQKTGNGKTSNRMLVGHEIEYSRDAETIFI